MTLGHQSPIFYLGVSIQGSKVGIGKTPSLPCGVGSESYTAAECVERVMMMRRMTFGTVFQDWSAPTWASSRSSPSSTPSTSHRRWENIWSSSGPGSTFRRSVPLNTVVERRLFCPRTALVFSRPQFLRFCCLADGTSNQSWEVQEVKWMTNQKT